MARDERDAEIWDEAFDRDLVAERLEKEMMLEQENEGDYNIHRGRRRKSYQEELDEDYDPDDDFYEDDELAEEDFGRRSKRRDPYDHDERYDRKRENYRRYRNDDVEPIKKNKQKKNKSGKEKKRHPIRTFLLILLVLLLALFGYVFIRLKQMQEKGISGEEVSSYISDTVKESSTNGAMSDYLNIAILGVDSVEGSLDAGNNRSDVMVIASINEKTGTIKLMSVYRDTYLDIGNGNFQKANAAYAYGGPEQTVQMLDRNLDLNISDYAVVGFEGIARIIDAVGGVEIDIQEDEIEHLNNYQSTMAEETGLEYIPITSAGTQTLTGLQATAYCRIRYTSGGDFQRAERQRTVLTKTFEKIKTNPVSALASVNTLMSYVRTSLSTQELTALGLQALRGSIEQSSGFPREDLRTVDYIGDQSCVIPITLATNVTWLHEELFGDTGYVPSQTVQELSNYISSVSGY